jgi:tungstate transport system substrate-binding protein
LELAPLVEKGSSLLNVYSVISINADWHEGIDSTNAERLVEFLMSDEVQDIIDSYGVEEYGMPLFRAARGEEPSG